MKELAVLLLIVTIFAIFTVAFFVLLLVLIVLNGKKHNKESIEYKNKLEPFEQRSVEIKEIDTKRLEREKYRRSYEPKYLLTINEKDQYRKIQQWASKRNLIVFTKIRLLDIITPRKNQDNYMASLGKIQSKHVDFVICDNNLKIQCIIEINDNSHKRPDREERDTFVKDVLEACGYKILVTYNVTEDQLNKICGYRSSTIDESKSQTSG